MKRKPAIVMMAEVVESLGDGMRVDVSAALYGLRACRLLAVFSDDVIARDAESVSDQSGWIHPEFFGHLIDVVLCGDARTLMWEPARWVAVEDLELAVTIATRVVAEMASRDVGVTGNRVRMTEPGRGIGSHGLK